MTSPQAFIFDMDGVLVNTLEFHYLAWQKVAEAGHASFTRDDMDRFRGLHRRECLSRLFPDMPLSEQDVAFHFSVKDEQFNRSLQAMSAQDIMPGVTSLLEEARKSGIKLGVASSSIYARPILERTGLLACFDAIADGYTVTQWKPEPDVFLWVAKALGVQPAEAVVFEDAQAGVDAARRANMFVIGVGDPGLVRGADWIVPTLDGLHVQDIVDAWAGRRR